MTRQRDTWREEKELHTSENEAMQRNTHLQWENLVRVTQNSVVVLL